MSTEGGVKLHRRYLPNSARGRLLSSLDLVGIKSLERGFNASFEASTAPWASAAAEASLGAVEASLSPSSPRIPPRIAPSPVTEYEEEYEELRRDQYI